MVLSTINFHIYCSWIINEDLSEKPGAQNLEPEKENRMVAWIDCRSVIKFKKRYSTNI